MQEKDKKVTVGLLVVAGLLGVAGALALYGLARAAPGLASLSGRITDAETGEPIAGVEGIVYQDHDTETETYDFTTNSAGYYVIKNMLFDVDVTQMVVYAEGYHTYTNEDIPIAEGSNELNIQMTPS